MTFSPKQSLVRISCHARRPRKDPSPSLFEMVIRAMLNQALFVTLMLVFTYLFFETCLGEPTSIEIETETIEVTPSEPMPSVPESVRRSPAQRTARQPSRIQRVPRRSSSTGWPAPNQPLPWGAKAGVAGAAGKGPKTRHCPWSQKESVLARRRQGTRQGLITEATMATGPKY